MSSSSLQDQTGTASSSPAIRTPSPTIINVMLLVKKDAYEDQQSNKYDSDFRHFKASTEYHKTKDLLYVKALLGHKYLRTTLRYTQLLEILENDEYHCKTANNIKEATQLIENGFEYITEVDSVKLFRKRK